MCFFCGVNCIGLFAYLHVMGINSNSKPFVELMEGFIATRTTPTVALVAFVIVLGAPPSIAGLGV